MSRPRAFAMTTLRNDRLFLPRWVAHYGAALGGRAALYVILDGHDQPLPEGLGPVNVLRLPHVPAPRSRHAGPPQPQRVPLGETGQRGGAMP